VVIGPAARSGGVGERTEGGGYAPGPGRTPGYELAAGTKGATAATYEEVCPADIGVVVLDD
jgi:hypothetical protein